MMYLNFFVLLFKHIKRIFVYKNTQLLSFNIFMIQTQWVRPKVPKPYNTIQVLA